MEEMQIIMWSRIPWNDFLSYLYLYINIITIIFYSKKEVSSHIRILITRKFFCLLPSPECLKKISTEFNITTNYGNADTFNKLTNDINVFTYNLKRHLKICREDELNHCACLIPSLSFLFLS